MQSLVRRQFQQQRRRGQIKAVNPDQQIQRLAQRAEDMMMQFLACGRGSLPGFMPEECGGNAMNEQNEQNADTVPWSQAPPQYGRRLKQRGVFDSRGRTVLPVPRVCARANQRAQIRKRENGGSR